jgi:hypothetical protein
VLELEVFSKVLEVLAKTVSLAVGILTFVKIRKELQGQRKTAPTSRSSFPSKRKH